MVHQQAAGEPTRLDARLLIVGGGPFQLDIIRAAKRLVREVWVVDRDPQAPGMQLADHAVALDFGRPEQVVELARRERFDGVTTAASDAAVPAVALCVEECRLHGIDGATARRCRDKLETIETLSRGGLRVPQTWLVLDAVSARRQATVAGYPVVVKPRSGAGGRGVSIVRDSSGLEAAVARALRYARPGDGCLIQEWLSGHSVGAEVFLWNGRLAAGFCLGDQYTDGFVSPIGHSLPCALDLDVQTRVLSAVEAIACALGATSGPLNFDLRYMRDEVGLVEINPRLGGNSITQLLRTAYGVDLAAASILCALGRDPGPSLIISGAPDPCAARMMILPAHGPRVRALRRFHDWSACPDVLAFEITGEGELATSRVDDWAIVGHCLVRANSAAAAEELARNVADDVQGALTLVEERA